MKTAGKTNTVYFVTISKVIEDLVKLINSNVFLLTIFLIT